MAGEYDHKAGESLNRISALENYVEFQMPFKFLHILSCESTSRALHALAAAQHHDPTSTRAALHAPRADLEGAGLVEGHALRGQRSKCKYEAKWLAPGKCKKTER